MKKQPTPSHMLEELANRAIGQIDRLAVSSFESVLEEMTEFHKFLIEAYETDALGVETENYAQISSGLFESSPHQEWLHQYHRIFERAARYIGKEDEFAANLFYVPLRLLPKNGLHSSSEITADSLDIVSYYIHVLEDELIARSARPFQEAEKFVHWQYITDSDKASYKTLVVRLISAWGRSLQATSEIYRWRIEDTQPDEQWRRLRKSWPFIRQHLDNSAYMLATAVWQNDAVGSKRYAEMLLCWFSNLEDDLGDDDIWQGAMLNPDLLKKEWHEVKSVWGPVIGEHMEDFPSDVFAEIIKNAMSDVITITASSIFSWHVDERGKRGAVEVSAWLFNNELLEDRVDDKHHKTGFKELTLQIVRILGSGKNPGGDKGYGNWLDRLVWRLNRRTEAVNIHGRGFTPKAKRKRNHLHSVWLSCLLIQLSKERNAQAAAARVVHEVKELIVHEDTFVHGHSTLHELSQALTEIRGELTPEKKDALIQNARALNNDFRHFEEIDTLMRMLDEIISAVNAKVKTEQP